MGAPRIEPASGPVNGSNKVFWTLADYKPGSTRVFRNGVLQQADLVDGWAELGSKQIRLKEAPVTGDVIQIYYIAT